MRRLDRIGAVVHGPEVVDSGEALLLINYLGKFGTVKAVLGGTMGRVAVLDAGLEAVISIRPRKRPSQSIRDLEPSSDILFLLNQAKSRETGLSFGSMVAKAAAATRPMLQIDCGGRFVAPLAGEADEMAERIGSDLSLDVLRTQSFSGAECRGEETRRTLAGVLPGELISVNGTVVGTALHPLVELIARRGRIVGMTGAEPKQHGLEKLQEVDLEKAILRSGSIRRTAAPPRQRKGSGSGCVLIDHNAESTFEIAAGAGGAITIGDDTTAIAGEILARLGIPIIGIVDGDLDHLAGKTTIPRGSTVIRVKPGHDDRLGRRVHEEIFLGQQRVLLGVDDLVKMVLDLAGDLVVQVGLPLECSIDLKIREKYKR